MKSKIGYIIAIILLLLIASAVCSCKSTQYTPQKEVHIDTIRIVAHDTIKVTQRSVPVAILVPTVKLSNSTKDTISILTDGLYKSIAKVRNGVLQHLLETVPNASIKTSAQVNDTLKVHSIKTNATKIDSIPKPYPVIHDKIVYELHWYQKIFLYIGIAASTIIGIYIIMWLIKKGIIHL